MESVKSKLKSCSIGKLAKNLCKFLYATFHGEINVLYARFSLKLQQHNIQVIFSVRYVARQRPEFESCGGH